MALAGVGIVWMRSRAAAPPATAAPSRNASTEQVGALKEGCVGQPGESQRRLSNKDYQAAKARAQRALMLDPTSAEARQVLDTAERTAAELETVSPWRRGGPLGAGDTDRATKALARVLALDPRHPVAGELTAALNVHFRKQAEEARRMADDSRRGAEAGRLGGAEGYAQADRVAQEPPPALLRKGEFAVATEFLRVSATASTVRAGWPRSRRYQLPHHLHFPTFFCFLESEALKRLAPPSRSSSWFI